MKIVTASQNPVKIAAVQAGFSAMFPNEVLEIEGANASSGVKDQPMSEQEALEGATNRADDVAKLFPDTDYFIGIEGGIEDKNSEMHSFAWVVVRDKKGTYGKGKTGEFILPPKVRELILSGLELGNADDVVFGQSNSKQKNGAVGILTKDAVDRTSFYTQAVIFALIPFINSKHYQIR